MYIVCATRNGCLQMHGLMMENREWYTTMWFFFTYAHVRHLNVWFSFLKFYLYFLRARGEGSNVISSFLTVAIIMHFVARVLLCIHCSFHCIPSVRFITYQWNNNFASKQRYMFSNGENCGFFGTQGISRNIFSLFKSFSFSPYFQCIRLL